MPIQPTDPIRVEPPLPQVLGKIDISPLTSVVTKSLDVFPKTITETFTPVIEGFNSFKGNFSGYLEDFNKNIKSGFQQIQTFFTDGFAGLTSFFSDIPKTLTDFFSGDIIKIIIVIVIIIIIAVVIYLVAPYLMAGKKGMDVLSLAKNLI